jgi:hypothetical protein
VKSLNAIGIAIIVTLAFCAVASISPRPANAQVANGNVILLNVGAPSSCAWPTSAATITNGMALCGTTSGLYYAINGGTFVPVGGAAPAGVTSFNGRTGTVTLTKADVTASGLAATTTLQ